MDPYLNIFDEPTYRRVHKKAGNSTAIVVGAVALVVALIGWWAYNKSIIDRDLSPGDVDPDTVLGDDVNEAINNATSASSRTATDAEIAAARVKAKTDLLALKTRLEAEKESAEAIAAVENLESDLEKVYANATGEVEQEWEEMKVEFDLIEQGLRNGTADTANIFAGLILLFEDEVRTDEE